MKITDLATAFIIILLPFIIITTISIDNQRENQKLKAQYNVALEAAVQDAGRSLIFNESQTAFESNYESSKRIKANKEAALSAFFKTLFINFNAQHDRITQDIIKAFIPVILVIDYDGFYVYAVDEYYNENGELLMEHLWSEKKPYTYIDESGNSLSFTLDNYIIAYDIHKNEWIEGFVEDIRHSLDIPLLNDSSLFDNVRRSTIIDRIQAELESHINLHNTYARRFGITYTFTLPTISEEDWNNTIDDVGIVAFIQGMPLGLERYNNYSFGGSRLIKNHNYLGTILNGIQYYYRSDCSYSYKVEETFSTAKEAAAAGYFPLSCRN